jgi:hypothetical protein
MSEMLEDGFEQRVTNLGVGSVLEVAIIVSCLEDARLRNKAEARFW